MKKIPTLFVREFKDHKIVNVKNEVTKGCELALSDKSVATLKLDGTCCMIKDGFLYARYDAKKGKIPPNGAIPCQDYADEITGHFPHWIKVEEQSEYKWHKKAFDNQKPLENGTYELCGKKIGGNKENIESDIPKLIPHGKVNINVDKTFDGIKSYLENNKIEGIVFWVDEKPLCKIKRSDFGFEW